MKRWFAIALFLPITSLATPGALAQEMTPRVRTITVEHAHGGFLGVGVAEIDEERTRALGLKSDHGVVVMNVGRDTPAAKVGLKEHDVILEFNGQRVEGVEQFMRFIRETPANRKGNLLISRGGSTQTVSPVLVARESGPRENTFELHLPDMPVMPDVVMPDVRLDGLALAPLPSFEGHMGSDLLVWPQGALGIEALSLNSQLAEYFGVKSGVLVRSVNRNSPAETAGLKAGDVITKLNEGEVRNPQQLARLARSVRAYTLAVVRNHKDLTLSVKAAAERRRSGDDEDSN